MKPLFILLMLSWSGPCFAQRFGCLDAATRVQLADSLTVLHTSRMEANAWRTAFLQSDSLNNRKDVSLADLNRAYDSSKASEEQRGIQAQAAAEQATIWRKKARARSVKVVGVLGLFIGYVVVRK